MKKKLWFAALFLCMLTAFGQKKPVTRSDKEFDKGSGIDDKTLALIKTEDLKAIGLIWGFLKYYHPSVTAGNYNWDYELFRLLPRFSKVKNAAERDAVLLKWIRSLGPVTVSKSKAGKKTVKAETKIRADLDWISKSGFSKELTAALTKIRDTKKPAKQHYVALGPDSNPEFPNENAYAEMKYSDAGLRLLSLYRYWNCIQYFFPYKYLLEEDWKEVLTEFIPKFTKPSDELAYKLAVLETITRIHDTHANLWNSQKVLAAHNGLNVAPVEITFAENKAVVTGFYNDTGKASKLEIGDVISHINDKHIDPIVKSRLKYLPASNTAVKMREAAFHLLRTNDSVINVSFVRKGVLDYKRLKTVPLTSIDDKMFNRGDTCLRFISPKIAYLYLGSIQDSYVPKIIREIDSTSALIIDLRCYPGTSTVNSLGNYLKPVKSPFVKLSFPDLKNPGNFIFTKPVSNGGAENPYKGKVIILVNEITQSHAEYTAMAFRSAPNAVVIGSTTAGADGNVSNFVLPGGFKTAFSGLGVYYPDGRETQRVGIVPDIKVTPTVKGIREKRDEVLEKAIELIGLP